MFIKNQRRIAFASAWAVIMSLGSTAALGAMDYEGDEDDADLKSAACAVIGCPNGNRLCGSVGGTVKAGVPPFVGEASVTYTCYERADF